MLRLDLYSRRVLGVDVEASLLAPPNKSLARERVFFPDDDAARADTIAELALQSAKVRRAPEKQDVDRHVAKLRNQPRGVR